MGSALGAMLVAVMPPGPATIAIGIFSAMLLAHLLHLPDAARRSGYVCGIILRDHADHAWTYSLFRFVETALGSGVAVLVSLLPKAIRLDEPEENGGLGAIR